MQAILERRKDMSQFKRWATFFAGVIALFLVPMILYGEEATVVKPGVEMLFAEKANCGLIEGKRVGLITNPTGVDHNFNSTIDLLADYKGCRLVALFGPEHGLRGDAYGGAKIGNAVDLKTSVTIYSLYGAGGNAPSQDVLKKLDVLIYDIQDIGVRPYTYISTMMASMEAAKKAGVTFVVLDRPDPMGGDVVDGPVLDPQFKSFIGYWTIPYTYGLTPGELANFYNTETGLGADLHVVKMSGWKRGMTYNKTGLPWVPPSTHIPRWDTSFFCAITGGMGELHMVNEGVGYTLPFETAAAPWIDGTALAQELNSRNIPGVRFRPISYKPAYFAFKDQNLSGVHIYITEYEKVKPFLVGLHIMDAIGRMYPENFKLESGGRISSFNRAMGTDKIMHMLTKASIEEIDASYRDGLKEYMKLREKYLLYK
jgi:uncharacterized protein YbbC (DUF1343 family)